MDSLEDQFNKCNATISLFKIQINNLQQIFKDIEKQTKKELKNTKKLEAQKLKDSKRANIETNSSKRDVSSGIATPKLLSNDLCVFLDIEGESKLSRTQVTKLLFAYIKTHGLYSKELKQIIPDEKLNILDLNRDDVLLTHFTIQKSMNKHYL